MCVLVIRNGFSHSFLLSSLVIQVLVSVNQLHSVFLGDSPLSGNPLILVPGTSPILARFMACHNDSIGF